MAKRRKKSGVAQKQMTVDEFVAHFHCTKIGKSVDGGIVRLYNPVADKHLRLEEYDVDLFNSVFARITINVFHNTVKIWTFGERKQVKDDTERGYHYEYHYNHPPKYEIHGMICPDEDAS